MKKSLSLFYLLFFSLSIFGQTFHKVSPTPTEVQYNDIAFADSLNVWVIGEEGTILHSSDRGGAWEVLPNITNVNLKKVFFLDQNRGWIVGGNDSLGVILQTLNGGITWSIDSTFQKSINDIFINDTGTGWMVGNNDFIQKTTDAGDTWISDSLTMDMNINRIFF